MEVLGQENALSFVNIFVAPVSTAPVKAKREKRIKEAAHHGWFVTGVSPASMALSRRLGESDDQVLRRIKREKVRAQAFFSATTAGEFCELARKAGWMDVQVVEKKTE